ncbi:glycosyltransferase family 4 protein [Methylolobus aquaticus]
MRAMDSVLFLHPPLDGIVSGGNRYNQRMIARAHRLGFPLRSSGISAPAPLLGARMALAVAEVDGIRLWDSLLMAAYSFVPRPSRCVDAWLMHSLPSLNPGLSADAAAVARRLEDTIAASSGLFLATGQSLAAELMRRYPNSRVWVCEPGVDANYAWVGRVRSRRAAARSGVELLTVANLLPAKGYQELVTMLRRLMHFSWRWHIVGSGGADRDFAASFLAASRDLIESGRIVWHGALEPAPLAALMGQADLYLSASHFESYGMAVAEAVAAGLEVIATEVGDAARIVDCSRAGVCVPAGRSELFAQCVADWLEAAPQVRAARDRAPRPYRRWGRAFATFAAALDAIGQSRHRR